MNTQNDKPPYVGPRMFEEDDRHHFFGREREARDLFARVVSERLVLFYAQSGAGKSSLVNTCLRPDLDAKKFVVFPTGRVGGELPPETKVENIFVFNLINSLTKSEVTQNGLAQLSITEIVSRLKKKAPSAPQAEEDDRAATPHVLIIDQFEELFSTHSEAWTKREGFFEQLGDAMERHPDLWVVLVMREDYIASLDPYAHLLPGRLGRRYYMQRLERDAAIKAVRGPVETLRPFAAGVAEKLVDDLSSIKVRKPNDELETQAGQYVEPVQLQVVCQNLWERVKRLPGSKITMQNLHDLGNVNEALENYYDEQVKDAGRDHNFPEREIREWFQNKLITSGNTRNMVPEDSIKSDEFKVIIQTLEGKLIRTEPRAGQIWYELSHDRLIEPVRRSNTEWISKNLKIFQRQAVLWEKEHRSPGLLLRGRELRTANREAKSLSLTTEEKEFLNASQKAGRRNIVIVTLAAISIIVMAILSYTAVQQSKIAEQQASAAGQQRLLAEQNAAKALENERLAKQAEADAVKEKEKADRAANQALTGNLVAQAGSVKNSDYSLALLLGIEAYHRGPNLLTRTTLFQLLQFSPYKRLFGFNGAVTSIAVSPDGKWIAVSSSNQIDILDSKTHQIVFNTFEGLGSVNSLAFNNDGTLLAVGGCVPQGCQEPHGQITFWDTRDPQEPLLWSDMPNGHAAQIKSIAFSPDGKLLASGSYDRQIILWDVSEPDNARPMGNPLQDQAHGGQVTSIAFSPDGKTLASASDNGSIHLWNVSTPETATLIGTASSPHTAAIYSIAFSLKGEKFAAASDDQTVSLWDWNADSASLQNPVKLEGHGGFVRSVAFNADGTQLASAGFDNTIILWNAQTGERIGPPLSAHVKSINTVILGAAETQDVLFSGSNDRTVIFWDLSTRQPLSQPVKELLPPAGIGQTAKNGNLEATAEGQQIKLQDSSGTSKTLTDHTGTVNSLSFSPQQIEGKLLLASASNDQTVILWDVSNVSVADVFLKLEGFEGPVTSAFFSEGGKLITIENGHTTQWIIDPGVWKVRACEAANRNLTVSEWVQFLGSEGYRKTCESIR